jgi:hypothetical protein
MQNSWGLSKYSVASMAKHWIYLLQKNVITEACHGYNVNYIQYFCVAPFPAFFSYKIDQIKSLSWPNTIYIKRRTHYPILYSGKQFFIKRNFLKVEFFLPLQRSIQLRPKARQICLFDKFFALWRPFKSLHFLLNRKNVNCVLFTFTNISNSLINIISKNFRKV